MRQEIIEVYKIFKTTTKNWRENIFLQAIKNNRTPREGSTQVEVARPN